jgi:hypothetical protein
MLSLATSRSKTPSAQPSDPNIRLGFGETAARRSFFFACGILANVYSGPSRQAAFFGPTVANGALRTCLDLLLARRGRKWPIATNFL